MTAPTSLLGDVCQTFTGGTPSRTKSEYFGGGIPWVKITDMLQGTVLATEESLTDAGIANSSAKILPVGTVLISIFATIGRTAVLGIEAATNQAIAGVVPKDTQRLQSDYLRYYLDSRHSELNRAARGVAQPNINQGILKSLEIPIPPLSEQRRIVDLLSRAEGIVRLRREAEKKAAELIPALFLDMFGDPATNPKGWTMVRLGDLAEKMSDGPFGSNLKTSHYVEAGVRVIRLQNIGIGELIDDAKAYVSPEHFASLPRHRCLPDDVIIGTLGDPNLRAFVLPSTIQKALNKADCVQFRCRHGVVSPAYICWLMNMPSTLAMAASLVQGITLTRISMGRLREMTVPVPPFDVQKVFADRVEMMNSIKSQQSTATAKAQATCDALLAKAYSNTGAHL